MIKLQKVSKRYKTAPKGEWALRDVDLHIERGELTAIVGTSGSGKTTMLNVIGGLDRGYEGKVIVDGKDLAQLSDRQLSRFRNSHIGFVFQQFSLLEHVSTLENVMMPTCFDRDRQLASPEARAKEVLDQVGLAHKVRERPANLSGGQRQRVAIARALLFKPPLLLCDEPTGSLDTATGQEIIEIFQSLNEEGYTICIITHEFRTSNACNRIVRIEDGHIQDATSGEHPVISGIVHAQAIAAEQAAAEQGLK